MLAAQPVAPVPVATIRPDEDWRSLRARRAQRVARRLVGDVADEDLVEREQPLAVVEARLAPSCAPRSRARPAATSASSRPPPRAVADQHARDVGSG